MIDPPLYPEEDFNRGVQLLAQLGSFWFNIFEDREQMRVHLRSSAHEQIQTQMDFFQAVATTSRFTVPIFKTENWHLITVRRTESEAIPSVYKGGDLTYGPQAPNGRPTGFTQEYAGTDIPGVTQIRLPEGAADARFTLQNAVVMPSKIWVRGVDYTVDTARKTIRFRDDPFNDPRVPSQEIFDENGARVDQEIALWMYRGEFDLELVYNHFGYVLGLKLASSQGYKDLLNAFWDMHVLGPSRRELQSFLAALSGNPIILNPRETVEVVQAEETSQLIVTDLETYRVPLGAAVLLSVGEEVFAGDVISDAVQIEELSGANPDFSLLPSLTLSRSFLSGNFISELSFRNERAVVEYVGIDEDGKAEVRFEVSGFPGDVDSFWEAAQEQGKADGATLANLLDTRENKIGEPGPTNIPAFINPMEFMLNNLMRNNLFLIKVVLSSFSEQAPGASLFRLLRDVVPPHTTYIVFIELTPADEVIDLGAGGEQEPGAEEVVGVFSGAGPVEDDMFETGSGPIGAPSYEDAFVQVKLVSLTCQ